MHVHVYQEWFHGFYHQKKREKNAVNSLSVVEWADALGSTKNMNRNHRAQINVLQLA